MSMPIPGSEAFSSRPVDPDILAASLPPSLPVHTVTQEQIDDLDPLTYEVVRHRLWSVTEEMGEALKRMSGSPIVTDANDFDFAIGDELGQEVQVGLYNTMLVGAVDLAISWTLAHRATNPGITEGDMFLCNDPWVGGGLHQNDVIIYQPIFHEGKLFAWTSAVCHEPDLGGVGLGSFSPAAQDVFSESLPTPPVKVVRDFTISDDVADLYVRRSRVPMLVGLDLRAQVGANNVGRERILAVIAKYGADTVKAVMKRMMADAEHRLRAKLTHLPDGTWRATGYQDQSHEGDRSLHKITVAMTKAGDHLTFDFTGTDPQAGVINCTYAGMRGGVMLALLPILAGDIPWSAGGLMRCFDLIAEEGTINNATFPAAVSRGPIGPAWLTGTLVAECLSQLLDRSVDLGRSVQASCCGTWDTAIIAGLDERGPVPAPFLNIFMEPMAGGYGARPHADGMDTGGLFCIPMGRVPDTEMSEFLYPMLMLWRREEPDSGGPGRYRGGVSASLAMTPWGTGTPMGLVLASAGKAVAQNNGLAGGYPGNTGLEIIARDTDVASALGGGSIPASMNAVGGQQEIGQNYSQTYLAPGDVFYMHWQGGGGYGDPLRREPDAVAADLREGKITATGAHDVYGVVADGTGAVDMPATQAVRTALLAERRDRASTDPTSTDSPLASGPADTGDPVDTGGPIGAGGPVDTGGPVDAGAAKRLDENLVLADDGGHPVVGCAHCGRRLGDPRLGPALALARYDGPAEQAGPQVTARAADYVDDPVVFRQYCCPGCWTAIYSSIVPAGHADHVSPLERLLPGPGADTVKLGKAAVLGGGPGGLYAARLLKLAQPGCVVDVYEQGTPETTFGFGVGLAAGTQQNLRQADPGSLADILEHGHPHEMSLRVGDAVAHMPTDSLRAIGRTTLLNVLQRHAVAAGARLHHGQRVGADSLDADLIIAADGAGSTVRDRYHADFGTQISVGDGLYLWCGTDFALPVALFMPVSTDAGTFVTHAYPYAPDRSTFLVETDEQTWRTAGFDVTTDALADAPGDASDEVALRYLEQAFADPLQGHPLIGNRTRWLRFRTVRCARWHRGNVVLLGDAAHTAHYSIGSGTKLAMEDAIALVTALGEQGTLADALSRYEAARRPAVEHLQAVAVRSQQWWDTFPGRLGLPVSQLLVSYMTRAGKVPLTRFAESTPHVVRAALASYAPGSLPGDRAELPSGEDLIDFVVAQPLSWAGTTYPHRTSRPRGTIAEVDFTDTDPWGPKADDALTRLEDAISSGAAAIRIGGPGRRDDLLNRLNLGERLRGRGLPVIIRGPRQYLPDLAAGLVAGRGDLIEVD